MTQRLYVGNLSYDMTEAKLRDLFSPSGEIANVDMITDKFTGKGKGFAFVEMKTDEATQDAISRLDGFAVDDRNIAVSVARPRADRSGGGPRRY